MTPIRPLFSTLVATLALATGAASAHTLVEDAWVRATVPQQQGTGLFAKLKNGHGAKLLSASSPVAATVEIHEMAMEGNVMRMRPVPSIDLPKDQVVELKSGGYHIMLMNLKQQIKPGDTVPVTLNVEGNDGVKETVEVKATVRALGAAAPAASGGMSGDHKH